MEAAFTTAARAEQALHPPAEICGVLNRMPPHLLAGPDVDVIDTVDALMDDLYRRGLLFCPGHRWLSGPGPESIRGRLNWLLAEEHIRRDPSSGEWAWAGLTAYFTVGEP
ncbi:hypothetical protein [Streptomyces sp. NPDC059909]|uniref:hypothetical protein n=1 Tax=Streptomyces sp. NPDC059909 TaxID=3346998 RepID=UPI003658068C